MLPRLARAEDLKAVGTLLNLALLAVFAFVMAIALLILPIKLLIRWKRLSCRHGGDRG